MDRFPAAGRGGHGLPGLLGRERQNGGHQEQGIAEDAVQDGLRRTAELGVLGRAVQAVFEHIQVERAQVDGEEVGQSVVDDVIFEILVALAHLPPDLVPALQGPAVERLQIGDRNRVGVGGVIKEVAEQEAPGVADLAVGLDDAALDLGSVRGIFLVISMATQRRRISAPPRSMTSLGSMTLPADLDMARPLASRTKPQVMQER